MALAVDLDESEYKESVRASLERGDYTLALVVCGEAILQTLRRETDLSVEELKCRMRNCSKLEKLEKMLSQLAREARAEARERKASLKAVSSRNNPWQPAAPSEGVPTGRFRSK